MTWVGVDAETEQLKKRGEGATTGPYTTRRGRDVATGPRKQEGGRGGGNRAVYD